MGRPAPAALLALAEDVARAAGALLLEHARRGVGEARAKSSVTDPVTEADVAAERLIRERLLAARPDDAILGEEGGTAAGSTGLRWVVDPLDGTVNFLYGIPQWCVSIAVEDEAGAALAGVVHDPSRDECWAAAADGPATLDGTPVHGSACADLGRALLATGFGYEAEVRRAQAATVADLLPRVRDVRRAGAAALDLAWLAGGRADAYYERGVKPWDVAAGALIARRAGLVVEPLAARPPQAAGILAGPAPLVDALRPLVR